MSLFKNTMPRGRTDQGGDEDTKPLQVPDPTPLAEHTAFAPPMQYPTVGVSEPISDQGISPRRTDPLTGLIISPTTRQLTDVQPGTYYQPKQNTQSLPGSTPNATKPLREPMVIRGTGKKSIGMLPPPQKKGRLLIHLSIAALLVFVVLGTLLAVTPLSSEGQGGFNPFQSNSGAVSSRGGNSASVAQQAATATAVTQDGFDPGANTGQFAGVAPAPVIGGGGLNRFFYGQCTYWANMHYHDLTGVWTSWLGNADQWVSGAENSGWVVSGTPHVPSIIVLQPYVQQAGYFGHVAVVEKINSDGSVVTSNWNWAGGWGRTSYVTFNPGPGVSFIWAPGH